MTGNLITNGNLVAPVEVAARPGASDRAFR
jgi:hypothetical protein